MTYASEVLADSPLAYYRLGEASGTTLVDSSGNGRHGTYTSATLGVPGLLVGDGDTAAQFAGTGHGDVPYAAWMDSPTAVTVEAWIKTTSTGYRSILDRDTGSTQRAWQFRLNGGALEFVKISGGVVTASRPGTLNDGNPHHVAATYDGSNIRLYVDGALGATVAAPGTLASASAFTIGANRSSGYAQLFSGVIDEVAYYGSVLSAARITAHYYAGTATAPPPTALSAALQGQASLSATASVVTRLAAALAGDASLTADLSLVGKVQVAAALTAQASLAGVLSVAGNAPLSAAFTAQAALAATLSALAIADTSTRYANDGYGYDGMADVYNEPPIDEAPSYSPDRKKVLHVHQSMPAPTLVDGRPV